ncbi:MAG TPA: TonB-dependent receptor [Chitinophagaceae bacterium]|nr:TonB-dependent receptor [Chitinophagaceae bacterium]
MSRILLIGLLLLLFTNSRAQETKKQNGNGKITGTVIDSLTRKPVEYATITLFQQGSKKVLNGTITNNEGKFTLTDMKKGNYKMTIEFIGYRSHILTNIAINETNLQVDLKNIVLVSRSVTLQNVIITAPDRLIENKIDKIVFNAEKDLTSQGGVATDVLKKVPQVSVDIDGNVELAGSSSIQFLINGKPSAVFGSNITDVLQSIPASQIKSIEVITNPGAKYDAQGLGGIINIILKDNRAKGINGNLSLSGGTLNENGSFNFNARKGNVGFNAFISGNARLSSNTHSSSDRSSVDTVNQQDLSLLQDGNYAFKHHGFQSGFGFDWTYKKYNDFTGSFRYSNFGFSNSGLTDQSQVITAQNGGAILSSIASTNHTSGDFSFKNTDVNLSYKRTFKKDDQELDVSFNTSHGNLHGNASNYQLLMPQDSLYYGTNSANPGNENESELKADYTQPLKKDVILGLGGKISSYNISSHSNISSFQPDSKIYTYNNSLSNYLNYKQKVYAYYTEITFPVGKLFDTKIGGRYERTELNTYYSNAQQQAPAHGYNTFVPSIFFSRKLNDNETVKLSYSKRIERPDYRDLNPFINTTDPKNISAGNPYLQPEIGNRIELSYNRNFGNSGSLMVSAFYRTSDHDIQPFIVFYPSLQVGDSVYTNVAVSTRQNVGMEKNLGMNFFVEQQFTSKLSVRSNFFFFKRHTINALNPGYNSNSFNYRVNMNASYQFGKTFAAEFFGNFQSARHQAQGRYPSFTTYSFAFRKQFWNKKASLALTATNPFRESIQQRTAVFGPNFIVNGLRQVPFRSFGINFTWKFGKLEFKKGKEDNPDTNNNNPVPEGQ